MMKKLFAVVFTATLMAGSAWGGDDTNLMWDGTSLSGGTLPAAATTDASYGVKSSVDMTAADAATTSTGNLVIGASKALVIGGSHDYDGTVDNGSVSTNDTYVKIAGTTDFASSGGKIIVSEKGNLEITGALTLTNGSIVNQGVLTLGDAFTTGTLKNTGTINHGAAASIGALVTAAATGGSNDFGIIKFTGNELNTSAITASSATDASTLIIAKQDGTNGAKGAIDVGAANVILNGGTFASSATIKANNVLFATDTTVYDTTSDNLTAGYAVASGAEVQFATGTDIAKSAGTALTNAGTVIVASGEGLTLGDNYTSDGGVIDNTANASANGVTITTTADTGDSAGDDILDDLARVESGNIGNVTITNDRAAAISVAAQDGTVTLNGNQATAIAVDVGGADLVLNNATNNKYSDVTAATINVAGNGGATFSGAVTGDLDADKATTFAANSSFTGAMNIAASTTVTVATGSSVTVNDFTTAGANGVLANTGGDLTVNGTVTGAASGSLNLAGAGTTTSPPPGCWNLRLMEAETLVRSMSLATWATRRLLSAARPAAPSISTRNRPAIKKP